MRSILARASLSAPNNRSGGLCGVSHYLRIRASRLIDGLGGPPLSDGAVLIEGRRIVAAGPAAEVAPPPGATVEELSFADGTILPGLIDVHVHLTFGTGARTYEQVMNEDSDDLMLLRAVRNCQLHLAAGVTTVRDCGARNHTTLSLRDAAAVGLFPSPRLLVSGPPITITGGHFWWCNGEADGVEGVRRQARLLLKQGVDFLKIMASGGGTQGTNQAAATYSAEEIAAAVREAHLLGKLATAHCLAAESVANAVEGGIDQVEHINFIHPDGSRKFDERVAERIVERGIYVSPTIQTGYRHIERLAADGAATTRDRQRLSDLQYKLDTKLSFVRRFRDLGAGIVSGTDAIATFGDYAIGLELLVRAGLTPMEAILSATRVAAKAIGLGDVIGSLEPRKEADVIVANGDPSVDIRCLNSIALVVRAGEVVARPGVDTRSGLAVTRMTAAR
jgi:imidazolonepropionase-like amidohydrolase